MQEIRCREALLLILPRPDVEMLILLIASAVE